MQNRGADIVARRGLGRLPGVHRYHSELLGCNICFVGENMLGFTVAGGWWLEDGEPDIYDDDDFHRIVSNSVYMQHVNYRI